MPTPSAPETILAGLEPATVVDRAWASSRWAWIRSLPPASKGAVGVRLAREWLAVNGAVCTASVNSDADLVADGVRVEVKLSCRWADGTFRFQQLRDQDWDVLVAIGVEPDRVRIWVLEKSVALSLAVGQHTGAGAMETRWLTWPAANAPTETGSPHGDAGEAFKRFATLRDLVRPQGFEP